MKATKNIISLSILLIMLKISTFVSATNPEAYWGFVTLDGAPAPDGISVTVGVCGTGEIVGSTTTVTWGGNPGAYTLDIVFDDTNTEADEGAYPNNPVVWKVNGFNATTPAPCTDTAVSGNSNNNFNILVKSPLFCYNFCDFNNDGIYIKDWNDLMNAYKCFLGIEKNCKIDYQSWNLIKQEYDCFYGK